MKNITEFKIEYYGEAFLKDFNVELIDKNQTLSIPTILQFNSSWKITHTCDNCHKDVVFIEDSRKPERNYNIINNINSNFRADTFLKEVCAIFPKLEQVELEGIKYINRTDFIYQFDIQRKTSVELMHHRCKNCDSDYIGIIRIGYPLERERGTEARLGRIEVVKITALNRDNILVKDL